MTTIPPNDATSTGTTQRNAIHFSASGVPLGSKLQRFALLYARIALGTAFLSAVSSRFGLWQGKPGMTYFPNFLERTGELNFFMPTSTIPFLGWSATILEIALGLALIFGGIIDFASSRPLQWLRAIAATAAILLAIFATTMTLATGLKAPLDYSVFSASACALLLAIFPAQPATRNL